MILTTERLLLRPWTEADAKALYKYAKSPDVGPIAGWPVHTDVENSRQIIRDILSAEECYAVVLTEDEGPIGSIGLMLGDKSNLAISAVEGELGFWIGKPYWGQGLIPEAVEELLRHGFEDLGLSAIWCGYFDGNEKSRRVQAKCGFLYHRTEKDKPWPLIGEVRTQHISCLTKSQWQESRKSSPD